MPKDITSLLERLARENGVEEDETFHRLRDKIVVLIASVSFVMYKVVSVIDRYARKNYIPKEEMMQKFAQPDKYVPWSYEKRMRYYNYEQSLHRKQLPSTPPYVSYIETGYMHRRL